MKSSVSEDSVWMKLALKEAEKAACRGEVPVGAVAVGGGKVLARAHNLRESKNDPLGHAEIYLISKLSKKLKRWRLNDVALYVTLEPCLMCMGAMVQARIGRLVFGCFDPKAGACGSLYDLSKDARLNHRLEVTSGVMGKECSQILSDFFKKLRDRKRKSRTKNLK
ncbi:MAG: tRNA adenosine(34) deaminase TadA [bacterium]